MSKTIEEFFRQKQSDDSIVILRQGNFPDTLRAMYNFFHRNEVEEACDLIWGQFRAAYYTREKSPKAGFDETIDLLQTRLPENWSLSPSIESVTFRYAPPKAPPQVRVDCKVTFSADADLYPRFVELLSLLDLEKMEAFSMLMEAPMLRGDKFSSLQGCVLVCVESNGCYTRNLFSVSSLMNGSLREIAGHLNDFAQRKAQEESDKSCK